MRISCFICNPPYGNKNLLAKTKYAYLVEEVKNNED